MTNALRCISLNSGRLERAAERAAVQEKIMGATGTDGEHDARAVLACVDGSVYAQSVAEHAAWAAQRLDGPVELLQVMSRRERGDVPLPGRLIAGARRALNEQLAAVDLERSKIASERARLDLEEASDAVRAAGVRAVAATLRRGDLVEMIAEQEKRAELIVIGKRGEGADFAKMHLGSNLERILRAASRPVLITARAMRPIERFLIAFDGRAAALKAVDMISRSPLFKGLSGVLVCAGERTVEREAHVEAAWAQLQAGGVSVITEMPDAPANVVIPEMVSLHGADLLVMGAYGRSRLRHMMIGSTTAEVIRECLVSTMIVR